MPNEQDPKPAPASKGETLHAHGEREHSHDRAEVVHSHSLADPIWSKPGIVLDR